MPNDEMTDYFSISGDTAIFEALNVYDVPWADEDIASSLDILYLSHSGEKKVSPLIRLFAEDDAISVDNFALIIKAIYDKYHTQWARLWDVQQATYEALNNYDLTENETIEGESSGSESGTDGNTETIESESESSTNATAENETGIYGFASTKKTSADSTSQTTGTSGTTTGKSTTTDNGTYSKENSATGNTKRNLTRSGNIGIRSNQELIQQEIDLWKWNYFESVFNDIDKLLCLRIY